MATKISIVCLVLFALIVISNGASLKKRDVDQSSVTSDASQAIDKFFEDISKGVKQLASDRGTLDDILEKISSKASQFGDEVKQLGKDFGNKVQEAVNKQEIKA